MLRHLHTNAHGTLRASSSTRFVALLGLILLSGLAQMSTANAAIGLRVIADQAPLDSTPVQVYVTVNDSGGAPVTHLTQGDFRLTEDGSAQTISGFALPPDIGSSAISLIFLMDYSNSIAPTDITAIEDAVASFINTQLNADDVAAVIKFGVSVSVITTPTFTSVKSDLETAARSPFPQTSNKTLLYDAISMALTQLNTATPGLPSGPRAIILLTDGMDNGSTATLSDTLTQLRGSGVPVFTIAFGPTPDTSVLNSIAQQSSGQAYLAATGSDLQNLYAAIAVRLQNEYLLSYSTAINDCNLHTLTVQASGETKAISFRRCPATVAAPSTSSTSNSGGGGGGGAMHPLEWLLLALVAVYRKTASSLQRNNT